MAGNFGNNGGGPIIDGYLFWKGYFGDWRSRFIELHGDTIIYRFVKGGMEWGRIKLTAKTKCDDNSERHFCFVISDPITKERLHLAALNTSLKEAWTEAIQNALTSLRIAERKLKYGDHHRSLPVDDVQNQHKVYIKIIQARNLLAKDAQGCSDPYVKVVMGAATARTTTRKKNLDPDWGMVFPFSWDRSMRYARIEVWDEDLNASDRFLGMVILPVFSLKDGDSFTAWYPLGKRSTRSTVGGDIEIELACSGMPDGDSKAWRLFYQIQQLPELTMNIAAKSDGNGQIALDFDSIQVSRKDKTQQRRCLVGDTDSVSSDEPEPADPADDPEDRELDTNPASNILHGFPLRFPPIELEKLEDYSLRVHLKCTINTVKHITAGLLMLTNYRLIFVPNSRVAPSSGEFSQGRTPSDAQSQLTRSSVLNVNILPKNEVDLTTQIPISSISDVHFTNDSDDSNFETVRVTTTDCRVLVFQFVEDVDGLAHKHVHFINKTFGHLIRGVHESVDNSGTSKKHHMMNDFEYMVKKFAGGDSRDSTSTLGRSPSEQELRGVMVLSPEENKRRQHESRKLGKTSPVPSNASSTGGGSNSNFQDKSNGGRGGGGGIIGPSKLEKCWLRMVKEDVATVEALDSEEGTPGQRMHSRLKHWVINRACQKSIAINTNMVLLHTLRSACGMNPSAPQYFFNSVAEYNAAAASVIRHTGPADHSPLPLGWTSSDRLDEHGDALVRSKPERLRDDCTLLAVSQRVTSMAPLHNLYTKLLHNIENSWLMYNPHNEFKRMGVPNSLWRISYVNVQYELCETYPAVLAFPKSVDDDSLVAAAPFRSKHRLPTLSWRSTVNNATISRSSQPMVGLGNSRNSADEFLLREIGKASVSAATDDLRVSFGARSAQAIAEALTAAPGSSFSSGVQLSDKSASTTVPLVPMAPRHLVITDARPLLNARANQAAGKGVESDKIYENCSVVFLDIANIHAMRKSLELMVEANTSDDINWLRLAEAAGWLGHIRRVLLGASKIAHFLAYENLSVLVHCSDGWDRTSQLTSLSMLMMDGYYRTLKGFIVLIEKEWLSFGHKFGDRHGWTSEGFADEERSPIFAQFLDCVHQFLVQMPDAFEFNQELLLFLVTHLYSGWFGNFLFNSEYELKFHTSHKAILSIWTVVLANKETYKNPHYVARESPVVPIVTKSKLVAWSGWFLSWQDKVWSASWIETNQLDIKVESRPIDGKTCFKCEKPFTCVRRKHHCRCCAQIFCYDCCHAKRIVPALSASFKSRCCNECALLLDMDYFTTEISSPESEKHNFSNLRASLTSKSTMA